MNSWVNPPVLISITSIRMNTAMRQWFCFFTEPLSPIPWSRFFGTFLGLTRYAIVRAPQEYVKEKQAIHTNTWHEQHHKRPPLLFGLALSFLFPFYSSGSRPCFSSLRSTSPSSSFSSSPPFGVCLNIVLHTHAAPPPFSQLWVQAMLLFSALYLTIIVIFIEPTTVSFLFLILVVYTLTLRLFRVNPTHTAHPCEMCHAFTNNDPHSASLWDVSMHV